MVDPCEAWPQGIVTAYNGWMDLRRRLEICRADPSVVQDGVYIDEEVTCL